MKNILSLLFLAFLSFTGVYAQDAKKTMDKAVAAIAKSSVSVTYNATGQLNESGTLQLKGSKFCARGTRGVIWYDGKTQWIYLKSTNEVNITTPNPKKPLAVSPYAILNLYRNGYDLSQQSVSGGTEVYMKAQGTPQALQEIYVTLNASLQPTKLRFRNPKGWTTITLTGYKTEKLANSVFTFNKKDYPDAEVVDLR